MTHGLDTEMAARIDAVRAMSDREGDELWLAAHDHMMQLLGEIGYGTEVLHMPLLCDLLLAVIDQVAVEAAQSGEAQALAATLAARAARAGWRKPRIAPAQRTGAVS